MISTKKIKSSTAFVINIKLIYKIIELKINVTSAKEILGINQNLMVSALYIIMTQHIDRCMNASSGILIFISGKRDNNRMFAAGKNVIYLI